jgi:hypothetical protein
MADPANDHAFSGGAQAPSAATRGSAATSRPTGALQATPKKREPLGTHLANGATSAISEIFEHAHGVAQVDQLCTRLPKFDRETLGQHRQAQQDGRLRWIATDNMRRTK